MAVVAALLVAWLVDDLVGQRQVPRGTNVIGIDIAGIGIDERVADAADITAALEPLSAKAAEIEVELLLDGRTVTSSAGELGVGIDVDAIAAVAAGPSRLLDRPVTWLTSFFAERDIDLFMTVDKDELETMLQHVNIEPETPRITLVDGIIEPVMSEQVSVPDIDALADMLESAVLNSMVGDPDGDSSATSGANSGSGYPNGADLNRVVLEVPVSGTIAVDPLVGSQAEKLAAQANLMTAAGAVFQLEGTTETVEIGEAALRALVLLEGQGQDTRVAFDDGIVSTLSTLFAGMGAEGSPAVLDVDFIGNEDGVVVITGGEPGFECCGPNTAEAVLNGLTQSDPVITVPAVVVPHPRGREWAESLGLIAVVGEFTTRFKAGQSRVHNIARISELTRGALIDPGGQFSVNDFVGRRTRAKGFVSAGVIHDGVFTDSVGGGISQYATTLFNAAFFAGLDFGEYQSHSIYISRYPYGREATVSYPRPDLVIKNTTPYTVMVWPTTTRSSVTVRLYSTPWVVGEQTAQKKRQEGTSCTRVTTTRTRTWLSDDHTETDTVTARYRPEGLKCDGSPSTTTTTTTTTTITTVPVTTTTTTITVPVATTTVPVATTTTTTTTVPVATTTTVPVATTTTTTTTVPVTTTTTTVSAATASAFEVSTTTMTNSAEPVGSSTS